MLFHEIFRKLKRPHILKKNENINYLSFSIHINYYYFQTKQRAANQPTQPLPEMSCVRMCACGNPTNGPRFSKCQRCFTALPLAHTITYSVFLPAPAPVANMCSACGVNPANPGKSWCQACWVQSQMQQQAPMSRSYARTVALALCPVCRTNQKTSGQAWCGQCYGAWKANTTYRCTCGNPIVSRYLNPGACYKCQ